MRGTPNHMTLIDWALTVCQAPGYSSTKQDYGLTVVKWLTHDPKVVSGRGKVWTHVLLIPKPGPRPHSTNHPRWIVNSASTSQVEVVGSPDISLGLQKKGQLKPFKVRVWLDENLRPLWNAGARYAGDLRSVRIYGKCLREVRQSPSALSLPPLHSNFAPKRRGSLAWKPIPRSPSLLLPALGLP
jgi:hypothetical protein